MTQRNCLKKLFTKQIVYNQSSFTRCPSNCEWHRRFSRFVYALWWSWECHTCQLPRSQAALSARALVPRPRVPSASMDSGHASLRLFLQRFPRWWASPACTWRTHMWTSKWQLMAFDKSLVRSFLGNIPADRRSCRPFGWRSSALTLSPKIKSFKISLMKITLRF